MRRFFQAMNDKDVNQLLLCVDPRQERMFRATFRIVEKATGLPVSDLLELFPGLNQTFANELGDDFHFGNIRLLSKEVAGDGARVRVSVNSTYRSRGVERKRVEKVEFELREFDEVGWRIVGIRPAT